MPVYVLEYQQNNVQESVEWITPTGWNDEQIRNDFERRFHAEVIDLHRVDD